MSETNETILERLMGDVPDRYEKKVGSFFYDTQKPVALEGELLYNRIDEMLNRAFVSTAEGEDLDKKVAEIGVERKEAARSKGTVTITGEVGAVVPFKSRVASDDIIFTVIEEKTIPIGGNVNILVECDTPGDIGNVPAEAIKRFPTTIAGLSTVTNSEKFTGGYDAETDEELRNRYYEIVSMPPTSGNKYDYVAWAKGVSGVGDAKCIPLWNGNGTVKVIIINSLRQTADEGLIQDVVDRIESRRPVGATVTVESATPLVITVTASVTIQSGYVLANISAEVEKAIDAYLKKISFEQEHVSYAHIGGAILQIDGVIDYENLKINAGTANVNVGTDEVPVLGVVTLSESD